MKGSLDKLSPATLTVYAVAMKHRVELGDWPGADAIVELAEAEGANSDAVLVLTRYELPAADGRGGYVKLRGGCQDSDSHVVVKDAETMRAIMSTGWGVQAIMKSPQGKVIRFDKLRQWVGTWETCDRIASM